MAYATKLCAAPDCCSCTADPFGSQSYHALNNAFHAIAHALTMHRRHIAVRLLPLCG